MEKPFTFADIPPSLIDSVEPAARFSPERQACIDRWELRVFGPLKQELIKWPSGSPERASVMREFEDYSRVFSSELAKLPPPAMIVKLKHPEVAGLIQERDNLHRRLSTERFNSQGQCDAIQSQIDKLDAELQCLQNLQSHAVTLAWEKG